jgi:cytochrome c oxidase subunit I+III
VQIQRLPGPSFVPLIAAFTVGGFFIFGTFHWWGLAMASLVLSVFIIGYWLWTGTARIPEKDVKDAGLGSKLPLYASGSASVGWWGLLVTMLADLTAFLCIVFGYFFFWSIHEDFPPDPSAGPGVFWPSLSAVLLLGAWGFTIRARDWNRNGRTRLFFGGLAAGMTLALAGSAALLTGPWVSGLDPTTHAYPATVWLLAAWTVLHVAVGVLLQLFCGLSRFAGRMNARHDLDMSLAGLYWHFTLLTAAVTVLTIAGFPLVS